MAKFDRRRVVDRVAGSGYPDTVRTVENITISRHILAIFREMLKHLIEFHLFCRLQLLKLIRFGGILTKFWQKHSFARNFFSRHGVHSILVKEGT